MRADVFLVKRGLAASRESAKKLIEGGYVAVNGRIIGKPSADIPDETDVLTVNITPSPETKYVSRGGLKLEAALDTFGISVAGVRAIDIGASTGGFTDCLLAHGAAHVTAVDSGHDQLAPRLAGDARVRSLERVNARYISPADAGDGYDIAVMDVSFISQTLILPAIPALLRYGGELISLIKPQFEVGRADVGKGGIVRSASARERAVKNVRYAAESVGFDCLGIIVSPITGGDGNTEYLARFRRRASGNGIK